MPTKNAKELFVLMLSHARQGTERGATIFKELGEAAQNEEIKEALQARAFVAERTLEKLDQALICSSGSSSGRFRQLWRRRSSGKLPGRHTCLR